MSIANDAMHRAGWQARRTFISRAIDDLRSEITVALQGPTDTDTITALVECDVYLELAQKELQEAANRVASIKT